MDKEAQHRIPRPGYRNQVVIVLGFAAGLAVLGLVFFSLCATTEGVIVHPRRGSYQQTDPLFFETRTLSYEEFSAKYVVRGRGYLVHAGALEIGTKVPVTYFRPWPRLAWMGSRSTGAQVYGLVSVGILALVILALYLKRAWVAMKEEDRESGEMDRE